MGNVLPLHRCQLQERPLCLPPMGAQLMLQKCLHQMLQPYRSPEVGYYVARPALEASLVHSLRFGTTQCVVGPRGCGKSALINTALDGRRGIAEREID